jgi:hypothetical protein
MSLFLMLVFAPSLKSHHKLTNLIKFMHVVDPLHELKVCLDIMLLVVIQIVSRPLSLYFEM